MEDTDLYYIVFVLGYDLLHLTLIGSDECECDLAFDKCCDIAKDFLNSEYNVNTKGLYECLQDYLKERGI